MIKLIRNSIVIMASTVALTVCQSVVSAEKDTTIYVATNKTDENTVIAYSQSRHGIFELKGEYQTGGKGTGDLEIPALKKDATHPLANGDDPLISAYGIKLTSDKKFLLTVNAGDASVSLLKVGSGGDLELVNKVPATDKFPVSVAEANGHVIVASVGNTNAEGSIGAYKIQNGKLVAVKESRRDLVARPSTVAFSSNGQFVLVTELVTGKIKSFALKGDTLSPDFISMVNSPISPDRFQAIPVGFDIKKGANGRDVVAVSEARFLTPDFKLREEANVVPQSPKFSWQTGSLSTYTLDSNGELKVASKDVLTGHAQEGGEIANCGVEFSKDGETLWAVNALSSSLSRYSVGSDGHASLQNLTSYKQGPELQFLSDLKINEQGTQLYQLVGNMGQILVFDIDAAGDLELKDILFGLPALGAYGLEVL